MKSKRGDVISIVGLFWNVLLRVYNWAICGWPNGVCLPIWALFKWPDNNLWASISKSSIVETRLNSTNFSRTKAYCITWTYRGIEPQVSITRWWLSDCDSRSIQTCGWKDNLLLAYLMLHIKSDSLNCCVHRVWLCLFSQVHSKIRKLLVIGVNSGNCFVRLCHTYSVACEHGTF